MDVQTYNAALESCMTQIMGMARRYAKRTGLDADDLCQEGCMEALSKRERYDPERGEHDVVRFIAANAKRGILDYLRGLYGRTGNKMAVAVAVPMSQLEAADGESFESSLTGGETDGMDQLIVMDLLAALESVTEGDEWELLSLRLDGKTLKEVGEEVGVCESLVSRQIVRVGPQMRAVLQGQPVPSRPTGRQPFQIPRVDEPEPEPEPEPAGLFDGPAHPHRQLSLFN